MNITSIISSVGASLIVILTVIEKSQKIKWKPLSWLFGRNETVKSINELKNMIQNLDTKVDKNSQCSIEHYKQLAKKSITDFAEELRHSKKQGKDLFLVKSKGQFVAIADLCNEYLDVQHWNSEVAHDAQYIREVFASIKDEI